MNSLGTGKSGQDLKDTWAKFLQEYLGVTKNVSDGIIAQYPTIRSLYEAYDGLNDDEAENLLSRVDVNREKSTRKLGTALSRKIYHMFNSIDPNKQRP
jgi:crossover junction endonuclease EME1